MRLLFVIYLVAEIYVFIAFISEFGFLYTLLELIMSGILGVIVLMSQRNIMKQAYFDIMRGGSIMNFVGKSFFCLASGILLIAPGILSDVIGIAFFIVSLFFTSASIESHYDFTEQKESDEDIIDAEIIDCEIEHDRK